MPNEAGGRADKLGNRYEDRWLIKQFIRLLKGKLSYVTLEPVGTADEGTDIEIGYNDGHVENHQCKGSNGSYKSWTMAALLEQHILKKAYQILQKNFNTEYHFISALRADDMIDLCQRAKNNPGDLIKFKQDQLTEGLRAAFKQAVMDMGKDIPEDQVFLALRRMSFEVHSEHELSYEDLCETLGYLVTDEENAYALLKAYIIEHEKMGCRVTQQELEKYLDVNGCKPRQLQRDASIPIRVNDLNKSFVEEFNPINETFIDRDCFTSIINAIENSNDVVVLGQAGAGKTGCLVQLAKKLEVMDIPYLAIKLDESFPEYNTSEWGKKQELPASPVQCLSAISQGKKSVLILDQLDAIRWTSMHNSSALRIMIHLLNEVRSINEERSKQPILIVFACRQFDFDNDINIQKLLKKDQEHYIPIKVGLLSDQELKNIVGEIFQSFSPKTKGLLRYPSNLYIWSKLEGQARAIQSQCKLISLWWEQIQRHASVEGLQFQTVTQTTELLNKGISSTNQAKIHEGKISQYIEKKILDFLLSEGILVYANHRYGYIHQSIYDYFISNEMLGNIMDGATIQSCLGNANEQTPMKRYQLQLLLEGLAAEDIEIFYKKGISLFCDENIRYYLRHTFVEVIGQFILVDEQTDRFIRSYLHDEQWGLTIFKAILLNHITFIRFLDANGELDRMISNADECSKAMELLFSINQIDGDFVADVIARYAFTKGELDNINCTP